MVSLRRHWRSALPGVTAVFLLAGCPETRPDAAVPAASQTTPAVEPSPATTSSTPAPAAASAEAPAAPAPVSSPFGSNRPGGGFAPVNRAAEGGGFSTTPAAGAPIRGRSPRDTMEQALDRAGDGEFDRARATLETLESDSEVGAWASYNLGVLAYRGGDRAGAVSHYEAALRAEPGLAPALVALIRLDLQRGDRSAARSRVERQRRASGDAPAIRAVELYVLVAEGRLDDVIREGRQILLEDEGNLDVFYAMALAYERSGRSALAEYIVDQAAARDPSRVEFTMLRTRIRLAEGNLAGARTLLRRVLEEDPYNAEALNNMGLVRFRMRDFNGAIESLEAAIRHAPEFAEAWLNLGNARKGARMVTAAREAYDRALQIRPGYADALFNLALLYMDTEIDRLGRVERLEKALEYFGQFASAAGTIPNNHPYRTYEPEARRNLETERELRAQREAFGTPEPEPAEPSRRGGTTPSTGTSSGNDDWGGGSDWDDWGDWGDEPASSPSTGSAGDTGSPAADDSSDDWDDWGDWGSDPDEGGDSDEWDSWGDPW